MCVLDWGINPTVASVACMCRVCAIGTHAVVGIFETACVACAIDPTCKKTPRPSEKYFRRPQAIGNLSGLDLRIQSCKLYRNEPIFSHGLMIAVGKVRMILWLIIL